MLGHVAQSVGGALPGALPVNPLISQHLGTFDVLAPAGATHAFVEILAPGAWCTNGNTLASAGGAASDTLISILPGLRFQSVTPTSTSSGGTWSVQVEGTVVVSASYPAMSNAATQAGPSGKYPGGAATAATNPGKGGGRLAGFPSNRAAAEPTEPGCGRRGSGVSMGGGIGLACVTFFRSYEAALAFANSLYGGNWQP